MTIPKVFISYSHDSLDHKKWVLDLATKLRASGVDASIDQWDLRPGDDLAHFMETNLAAAARVLMVCTEKYVEKANAGQGGVGYEKMIVTANLLSQINSNKIIPIIRQTLKSDVPTFLKTKLYLDFSKPDQFEFQFDELVRTIHDAPLFEKPPITKTNFPTITKPATPAKDGLKELMSIVVKQFENTTSVYQEYAVLVRESKISRVMLDFLFEEALEKGYLRRQGGTLYIFTAAGKLYALDNGLIS
jgi:TIR domain